MRRHFWLMTCTFSSLSETSSVYAIHPFKKMRRRRMLFLKSHVAGFFQNITYVTSFYLYNIYLNVLHQAGCTRQRKLAQNHINGICKNGDWKYGLSIFSISWHSIFPIIPFIRQYTNINPGLPNKTRILWVIKKKNRCREFGGIWE